MKLISLYSQQLAPALAKELKIELVRPELRIFADKESYIKMKEPLNDDEVILLDSTYPHQDRKLSELRRLTRLLKKRLGVKQVGIVTPYLAYMRQDKDFSYPQGFESIAASDVVEELEQAGADFLYTVDAHSQHPFANSRIYAGDVNPVPAYISYLSKLKIKNAIVVAPDDNAQAKVEQLAKSLRADTLFLEKTRHRKTGRVSTKLNLLQEEYEYAIIVDDIIGRGSTITEAMPSLRFRVRNLLALCTHGLMIENAGKRLMAKGVKEVISTDSIENEYSKISLANVIAERLWKDRRVPKK